MRGAASQRSVLARNRQLGRRHDSRRIEDIIGQSFDLLHREYIFLSYAAKSTVAHPNAEQPLPVGTLAQEILRILSFLGLPVEGEGAARGAERAAGNGSAA
jgi:hypothetical protein